MGAGVSTQSVDEAVRVGVRVALARSAEQAVAEIKASKYTDVDSIRRFAMRGDVQFVRASPLFELAIAGRPLLAGRQDLPARACVDAATIEVWVAEINDAGPAA